MADNVEGYLTSADHCTTGRMQHPFLVSIGYVDPRDRVQEIVYYADDEGFHVQRASNLPKETVAVQKARKYHEELFEKIRQEHARIAAERALLESQENQYEI
ncbi:hypothetical protein E2C01_014282 [Portunus trituberculatus]|uniref:Uncharacterized protein n=1 Tax=Portunus trituberculatus TaxID=210409 RepID=A0A5B7DIS1_PORTR|nr:hypothetical protein [Portunus trituberculatus]